MAIKVMTVVGTRPELIKLSRVIHELDQHSRHVLVHTGQNYDYELNEIFFREMEIRKPDYFLDAAGENAAITIGKVIVGIDEVLAKEKPDAFLLLGDTNSGLAAIAAKRRKIPVFHMEAGNRCFDERVPEEINRRILDHISDINLTYTEHARRYLLAEGIKPETVMKTGSPMKEVLAYYRPGIDASDILERMKAAPGKYFVLSAHREENVDSESNFTDLLESLNRIAGHFDKKLIFSTHPRTRKRLESLGAGPLDRRIHLLKPLGFLDYVKLQMHAFCVISDSGTLTEEASILNFPAVMIRQAHERPEGMDEGTVIMCGLKADRVLESIAVVTDHHAGTTRPFRLVSDYDTENVSKKIVRIIMSYTDYVNRTVWYR
ncbi:MAG TPA: UDP-N-acetylglucosamine 2-epimerase (non-hydrolyzing) [Candidatus Latescibacteria bacterium]|nr:UDP-N-acetylglucosamine 2-epimerase (non-hydrolyzing) [Candidatus Latescibacterota bacterium]